MCSAGATDRALESVFAVRKANAWIYARRATDRALQRQREFFCEFLDMCSARATDRDLQSVFPREKVNAWICPRQATDRNLESVGAMKKVNAWICAPPTTGHDPANLLFF